MNAPFQAEAGSRLRLLDLACASEAGRYDAFVAECADATAFHRRAWLQAVAAATGHSALVLLAERRGEIVGALPLHKVHSPLFGRMLASTGFAVGGGVLATREAEAARLIAAAEELALRRSCPTIELRGGFLPEGCPGWTIRRDAHCGFVAPLAADDAAQMLAIPRKQRAELRKGLEQDLRVTIGRGALDRAAHHAVYAESLRNLGAPVFPRALFAAVLDAFGGDADILTVWYGERPVASVLSLYHRGAVMPYWGGGTRAARSLRANDRMYFELMRHARLRGCERFDFGRSKTGSGAWHFKRNWGFDPQPLAYAQWTAPGCPRRDADPTSARHARRIALWQRLPLALANRLGPWIARGLG